MVDHNMIGSHSSNSTGECPYQHQHQHQLINKRKRTIRPRACSLSASSSVTSTLDESSSTVTEEEDMAHCLILLAQGRRSPPPPPTEKSSTGGVYECKTCNKCFSSFQALGGHRASHKKPRTTDPLEAQQVIITNNNKMKVHECSICGAEFSSGQALGGHMRRHRPVGVAEAPPELSKEVNKERNFLSFDLNLPATSDEEFMSPVAFSLVEKRPLEFSTAPALVDCYY